jgi:uncharacterized UPF0146 family protein
MTSIYYQSEEVLRQITAAHSVGRDPDYPFGQLEMLQKFVEALERNEIPVQAPDFGDAEILIDEDFERAIMLARLYAQRKRSMWAIVDASWTRELAEWMDGRRCLEVMAGAGWISKALRSHGVDIVATDLDAAGKWGKRCTVDEVMPIDALAAVKNYSDAEILLVSWPPYKNQIIERVVKEWGMERPIVYIGEPLGGCTATEIFCRNLRVFKRIKIPCWPGLQDEVAIGRYLEI